MRPAAISTGPAWHPARATGIVCLGAAQAGTAFPGFDGPVPGEQDVREDNAGVNPEVTCKRRSSK
jgi:hypothetical protein